MKLIGSVAVVVVPTMLYGCGGGLDESMNEDAVDTVGEDGVEHERTLGSSWPLQFEGQKCRGNLKDFKPKSLSQCQAEAEAAHALQYQFRESDGACALILLQDGCASPKNDVNWNTYKNPNGLWGVSVAGRMCTGKKRFVRFAQTVLECQQRAVDAGVEFYSFKESNSNPVCQVLQKCEFVKSSAWSIFVKPVPAAGRSGCACATTTTTTSTYAPWTHVEIDDFTNWQEKWGLNFDASEAALRLKIFEENTRAVIEHNQGSHSWWKVQNQFTHLLQSEFEELLTFDESQSIENSDIPVFEGETPDHGPQRRLTERHWSVSPVKDQGSCGSCWAFATVAGMEAAARVHLNRPDILSEQQVMDCTSSSACSGGNAASAYSSLVGDALYTGTSYPYLMSNGVCRNAVDSGLRITAFVTSVPNHATDAVMAAGLDGNPLVVTVDASSWGGYGGGIHSCPKTTCSVNHQVLATGYDSTYFKLKNSWRSTWGEGGYIRISRTTGGCGTDGTSAILRHGAFYPVMEASTVTTNPAYFLAAGHATCDEACAGSGHECDLAALEAAAVDIDTCAGIIDRLGFGTGTRMTHQDDNAGCTWGPWGTGWAQLYRKDGLGPKCSERNQDPNRQRLCACKLNGAPVGAPVGATVGAAAWSGNTAR